MHGHLYVTKEIWGCRRDVARESSVLLCYTTSSAKWLQKFQSSWTWLFTIRCGITSLKTSIFRVDGLFCVFRGLCMFLMYLSFLKILALAISFPGKGLRYQWVRILDGPHIGSGRCGEDNGLCFFQRSIPFVQSSPILQRGTTKIYLPINTGKCT